jgi:hypothetical protein
MGPVYKERKRIKEYLETKEALIAVNSPTD